MTNLDSVGAAIIALIGQDGIADGHFLRLCRIGGGTVSVEVVAEASEGEPGALGTISLITFAGALAKKNALRVETLDGYYGLERKREAVVIEHYATASGLRRRWRGSLAELLGALKDLGSRAA